MLTLLLHRLNDRGSAYLHGDDRRVTSKVKQEDRTTQISPADLLPDNEPDTHVGEVTAVVQPLQVAVLVFQ